MTAPRFSEDIRPITELKRHAAEIVDHVQRSRRPVLLTRRGRGVAILLDLEEYEKLTDRVAFVEAVEVRARAAEAGALHGNEEAEAILAEFGRPHG